MRIAIVTLVACAALAGPVHAADAVAFDRYEVITGLARRQTILTGFLLGGPIADLAELHIDDQGDRHLRIYTFGDSTWVPGVDATLGPQVLFVDVASIGGRDRLITYAPGRLSWFDPESATERPLAAVTSSFDPPRRNEIPHVDLTHDLNGDAKDDLVVPDADGFWVLAQTARGGFADPVKIGPATRLARILGADGYRYDPWSQSRIYEIDYDHDGRSDLVYWNEDHFEVHKQDRHGLFAAVPVSFTTDVAFDSDELSLLTKGEMTGKVLHSLTDLNGDGVADLVAYSLEGKKISSKQSAYEVHLGARTPDGRTVFSPEVGTRFRSDKRIQLAMDPQAFDRDGEGGLMLTSIEVKFLESSLWKTIKGFMGDDIWLDVEFYRAKEGRYPAKASATHRIALDGVPSHREPGSVPLEIALRGRTHESRRTQGVWPRAFNRTLLLGDVTGDGRSDLLIESEFRELKVFVGVPGPYVFAQEPYRVKVSLFDEEYNWLVDLNRDGRQDILMHQPFALRDPHGAPMRPPGTEPQRVTMLIAR